MFESIVRFTFDVKRILHFSLKNKKGTLPCPFPYCYSRLCLTPSCDSIIFKLLLENVQKEPFVSPKTFDLLTNVIVTINARQPASAIPKIMPNIIRIYLHAVFYVQIH